MAQKRVIAVIDLKAFYSFVECVDRGLDPWKTPLVVCDTTRGTNTIILSVTPYLKERGVPSRLRYKELPKGFNYIYATPRMERYIEMSCEVVGILLDFVSEEDLHVYSIDESFIDLTSYIEYYKKEPVDIVKMIISEITKRTGLQATAGVGDNLFLSKVALDIYAKKSPDWIGVIHHEDVPTKLWPITPLSKIWGIGPNLERRLNNLGIFNVGQLAKSSDILTTTSLGIMGQQLVDHANGIDESDMHEVYVPAETSLSIGQTLFRDFSMVECPVLIRELNDDLSMQLREKDQRTNVVSLCIIYGSNQGGFMRQMSLIKPTNDTKTLFDAFLEIYNKNIEDKPIRQVHLCYGKLRPVNNYEQLDLFTEAEELENTRNLNLMIDEIRRKYGKNILLRLSALTESSTALERHTYIGGHKK